MKIFTIFVLAAACLSLSVAQGTKAAAPAANAKSAPAKPQKEATKIVRGTIVSLDAVANTITIKRRSAEETYSVDPAAKIKSAGKKVALADIKVGNVVTLTTKMVADKPVAIAVTETVSPSNPNVKKAGKANSAPSPK